MIYIWLYGLLFKCIICSAFILWIDHFLDSGAEICQIFRWFFGKFKKIKNAFWNQLTFNNYDGVVLDDISICSEKQVNCGRSGSYWFEGFYGFLHKLTEYFFHIFITGEILSKTNDTSEK